VDQPDQERDFFLSYTQTDRAWAEWLAWELEAAGYTTVLQAWDMPAGTAFVHAMDQAVQHARHLLLMLSPAYLRSAMAAVGGAVVHDPEHPGGRGVGLAGHDLFDQSHERLDASGGRAVAEHAGAAGVVGGQVGQRAAAS
jgi:TIR domain